MRIHPCWLLHTWNGWGDIAQVKVFDGDDSNAIPVAWGIRQERRCEVCNKVQLRFVKTK